MTGKQRIHILLIAGFVSWTAAQSQAQTYSMKALGVGPPTDVYYSYTTPKINNSSRGQSPQAGISQRREHGPQTRSTSQQRRDCYHVDR